MARQFLVGMLALVAWVGAAGANEAWQTAEQALEAGKLGDAEAGLQAAVQKNGADDEARFGLGVVQTLRAGEKLMQGLYRYGLDPAWATNLPFVRLPVPKNEKPEPLTNEAFRKLIAHFSADLKQVDATLAGVKPDDVKLVIRPGAYRLDLRGDGEAAEDESLGRLFRVLAGRGVTEEQVREFSIALDKGDAHWLRGYSHFLMALCEAFLTYDTQGLHDHAAQFFFPSAKVKYPFTPPASRGPLWDSILDGVAFIHLLNLPVKEPERLKAAHGHLLAMVEQSRASFAAIAAETDDDREWIPSPTQKNAALGAMQMSPDMVKGWHALLDEWEAILNGKKLVPFWRGGDRGVNVRRVFYDPTTFDLVLWVQGSAAVPYLEEGERTRPEFWRDIQRAFRGQLFWFAVWVN
jgi:hypothetical protein